MLPAGVVLIATLMAALPWGVAAPMRFALMLMPVVAIIHFTLLRPSLIPTPVAFAPLDLPRRRWALAMLRCLEDEALAP